MRVRDRESADRGRVCDERVCASERVYASERVFV